MDVSEPPHESFPPEQRSQPDSPELPDGTEHLVTRDGAESPAGEPPNVGPDAADLGNSVPPEQLDAPNEPSVLEVVDGHGPPGTEDDHDVPATEEMPSAEMVEKYVDPLGDRPEPDPDRQAAAREADPFYREVMLTKSDVREIEEDVDDRITAGEARPEDRDRLVMEGRNARFEEKARYGEFFSPDIQGRREATDRNATSPQWYEDFAESQLFEVRPTPGTTYYGGRAAPQGPAQGVGADLMGGGDQVFIPRGGDRENWSVRPVARDAAEAERLGDDCVIGYDESGELREPSPNAHQDDDHVRDHHAWEGDPFGEDGPDQEGQRTVEKFAGSLYERRTASDDAPTSLQPGSGNGGGSDQDRGSHRAGDGSAKAGPPGDDADSSRDGTKEKLSPTDNGRTVERGSKSPSESTDSTDSGDGLQDRLGGLRRAVDRAKAYAKEGSKEVLPEVISDALNLGLPPGPGRDAAVATVQDISYLRYWIPNNARRIRGHFDD